MPTAHPRRLNSLFGTRAKKERRPEGVSRKRRKQFSFETLEDRRVMSVESPVPMLQATVNNNLAGQVQFVSSSTEAGALEVLARELYWQSLMAANQSPSTAITNSIPTDPLFPFQWHLINTGQEVGNPDFQPIYGVPGEDINVAPVWNMGYTGAGVTVAVIDSGTQLDHPDLAGNINLDLAMDALNPSGTGNPTFFNPINAHGTAVAGLIGAIANNGIGGTGVAPGVSLVPIRLIDVGQFEQAFVDTFRHAIQDIDITNNSWGPGISRGLAGPSDVEFLALRDSVLFGRDGLGVIHVFSSGNDGGPLFAQGFTSLGGYDSSSYNGWVSSRYTIGVTGVDHDGFYNNVDGTITVYPEISPSVLVAVPTGSNAGPVITNDTGLGSGLWTTDLTGEFGFNAPVNPITNQETDDPFYPFDRDFLADADYTSRMNGTSASAPVLSGVIALMLEANPNLSWRDVQEILVRSARQNAPLGVPSTGQGGASGVPVTQNTWIVNQTPVFHDPDFWNAFIPVDPLLRTMAPALDPNQFLTANGVAFSLNPDHYVATPHVLTNGAGYTVSQGIGFYGEQVGYAHGVVDAEMAVQLAEQWHTKGQVLPPELTFSSYVQGSTPDLPQRRYVIPPAQKSSIPTFSQVVPGGIGGFGPFIAWWEEYFAANPNFPDLPPLYRGDSAIEFNIPADQNMTVETVEVKLSLNGGSADALNHLRILLISPDGTHSELNNNWIQDPGNPWSFQLDQYNPAHLTLENPLSRATVYGTPGSFDTQGGNLVWTFSTNRSWGERANDAIVFDPVTGEPAIDETGLFGGPNRLPGQALTQGWRLVLENYDFDTQFRIDGVEMAFHGSPIATNTQRVQGAVGIDQNGDDLFNFSRVIQQINDIDGDVTEWRLGEIQNVVDQNQEKFAGNVTVVARRASDNVIVDRFVTGHDGNFYFDLVPDDYIISIEDPLGRDAKEDQLTLPGLLRHYETEWRITPEHFKVWDHANGNAAEVVVDANGVPVPWLDGNGDEQAYGMKGINFLLDPGAAPAQQVAFTGVVYADTNGDGAFNSNDIALPNVSVFADVNRDGQFNSGEIVVETNVNGEYNLVAPLTSAAVMNVGVVPPSLWTATNPASGLHNRFVTPGDLFTGLDFFIQPGPNNSGGGGAEQPGILMGVVFEDFDGDGVRDAAEPGAPQFTVYIDANNNGVLDDPISTTTNLFGAYAFTDVAPGTHVIRAVVNSPFLQTQPAGGGARVVNLTGSSTISNLNFGVQDQAFFDFGDLPDVYATLKDSNGARHRLGPYWLGPAANGIDGELDGKPSADALGDNAFDQPDENGLVFSPIFVNSQATLTATPSRNGGYLQGWVDWNNDGDFADVGERVITNALLSVTNPALNTVSFAVPAGVSVANVYARFRYGEFATGANAISTPFGAALTGEVEDYLLTVVDPVSPVSATSTADFNNDDVVDGADFLTWQRNVGRASGARWEQGDANSDGQVEWMDYAYWKAEFGTDGTAAATQSSESEEPLQTLSSSVTAAVAGGGAWSAPAFIGEATSTASADATLRAGFRPSLSQLAGVAERFRQDSQTRQALLSELEPFIQEVLAEARGAVDGLDVDFLRRDRAFEDLFGSRRRQGLLALVAEELPGDAEDADEAFAALADHFEWPLG